MTELLKNAVKDVYMFLFYFLPTHFRPVKADKKKGMKSLHLPTLVVQLNVRQEPKLD